MDNIVKFEKREVVKPPSPSTLMFTMSVSEDENGMYEVGMNLEGDFEPHEIYTALSGALASYAVDEGIWEEDDDGQLVMDLGGDDD